MSYIGDSSLYKCNNIFNPLALVDCFNCKFLYPLPMSSCY